MSEGSEGRVIELETNSGRMPYNQQFDMKIMKNYSLGSESSQSVRLSFTIENLFRMNNVYSVYNRTGSAYKDGADISIGGYSEPFNETAFLYDKFLRNPTMRNNDRNYIFSVSYNF
jgi:hypothetical protein